MSKASGKAALKAIKTAVDQAKYEDARDLALKLLQNDPSSYAAHIYLGFALFRLHEVKDSEQTYQAAIKLNPSDPTAWQGLTTLYEETQQIDEYLDIVKELLLIYMRK
ncbi:hypothetical protein AA313_de0204418 [Arthrobotrys entomopaga]|nr:hypothetical protein AA313_de0204418 [Arthrobotrys entomopaga]